MRTEAEWSEMRERYRQGVSISQIARDEGLSRITVRKYVQTDAPPAYARSKDKEGKLDPFKPFIRERLKEYPLSAARLLSEIREQGYTGGYTILKEFTSSLRHDRSIPAEIRFETPPGEQAQVDWIDFGHHIVDGEAKHLSCFVMTLGYSRASYAEFTDNTRTDTFLQGHVNGIDHFGGSTKTILYDNLKSVVLKRALLASESTFNPAYLDFASFYDIRPRLCRPGIEGAKTKGKVERFIQYLEKDFFVGRDIESIDELNSQLMAWLDKANSRVHGTTGEVPWERLKQENLRPVDPARRYIVTLIEPRRIHRDCFVNYRGGRYSVPWRYAGRECKLHIRQDRFDVLVDGETIARHEVVPGRRTVRVKEHFEGLHKLKRDVNIERHRRRMGLVFDPVPVPAPEVQTRDLACYDLLAGGRMNDQQ
jgi:transposase